MILVYYGTFRVLVLGSNVINVCSLRFILAKNAAAWVRLTSVECTWTYRFETSPV